MASFFDLIKSKSTTLTRKQHEFASKSQTHE